MGDRGTIHGVPLKQLPMDIDYWEIDHEDTPFGRLVLRRYEASTGESGYEILLDGAFLMASHGSHSERAMAEIAHRRLPRADHDLTVLVGGLGAGHTLRAALDLPAVVRVEVAEIGAKVVEWNRRHFAEGNAHAVDDPRVTVLVTDVLHLMERGSGRYDLVLLDVDNGPGWLAAPRNAPLFETAGLAACRRSLRPGGVIAIWCPQRNPELERALGEAFGSWSLEDTTAGARREGEPPSVIYLSRREPLGDTEKN